MDNRDPFVAQRLFPEQINKRRARVKLAVLIVLAVHGIGMLTLLVQGCKQDRETPTPAGVEARGAAPPLVTNVATLTAPLGANR